MLQSVSYLLLALLTRAFKNSSKWSSFSAEVFHIRAKLYKNAHLMRLVNQVIESFVNNVVNGNGDVDKELEMNCCLYSLGVHHPTLYAKQLKR